MLQNQRVVVVCAGVHDTHSCGLRNVTVLWFAAHYGVRGLECSVKTALQ